MGKKETERIAVIVAHPDDETLWAGGILLRGTFGSCHILSLCRGQDPDRAPKFYRALKELGASGSMADLDDGPEQTPLKEGEIRKTLLDMLPHGEYDRIYTHSPAGEYTRHLRHEETGREILKLWLSGELKAREINLFAYEDGGHSYLPRPIKNANVYITLSEIIWRKKHRIIRDIYGFDESSFEARTTPRSEAFWQVKSLKDAEEWLKKGVSRL